MQQSKTHIFQVNNKTMNYNRIEKEFLDKATIRGGVLLFSPDIAISFLNRCREENIGILGIDAFFVDDKHIQPSMENSIDFSNKPFNKADDVYDEAVIFIRNKSSKTLFFEIVCDD